MLSLLLLFNILSLFCFFLFFLFYKEKKQRDDLYELVIAMLSVRHNDDELLKMLLAEYQKKWGKK